MVVNGTRYMCSGTLGQIGVITGRSVFDIILKINFFFVSFKVDFNRILP